MAKTIQVYINVDGIGSYPDKSIKFRISKHNKYNDETVTETVKIGDKTWFVKEYVVEDKEEIWLRFDYKSGHTEMKNCNATCFLQLYCGGQFYRGVYNVRDLTSEYSSYLKTSSEPTLPPHQGKTEEASAIAQTKSAPKPQRQTNSVPTSSQRKETPKPQQKSDRAQAANSTGPVKVGNKEVYQAIKRIADDLYKEGQTFLRADLAFELKKHGVKEDSAEVSKLVFEAYRHYNDDGHIAIAFITNNNRSTVVAEYKINDSLDNGQREQALKIAENELFLTESSLDRLEKSIASNLDAALLKVASKGMDVVLGTMGTKEVRNQAASLFKGYAKMVDAYHYAEDSVRGNIEDFTTLCTDIEATYREYAMKLIDIFGDSVKMVSPELFDFKQIEFLDVDSMLKHVELEYNKISEKCSALIGEISDSFRTSLQSSVNAYKSVSSGNKGVALAVAGLNMLNHYMNAGERTNRLRTDLSSFRTSIKHDATQIKADMGRLLVIHKSLNDVIIPKAGIFMRYCQQLMDSDLQAILDAIYSEPSVRPLEEKRRSLLCQLKVLDAEVNDHLQSIDIYNSLIADISASMVSKRPAYEDAKRRKPSKPVLFGKQKYYRDFAEWDAVCGTLIREYENYSVDLKLDQDELAAHKSALKEVQTERKKLSNEIEKLSKQIRSKISCSSEVQLKMLRHLRTLVGMLRLGREIAESKLDQRLVRTVSIPDYKESTQLPAEVEQNLSQFTTLLADNIHADQSVALGLLNEIDDSGTEGTYTQDDIAQVTAASEEALQKGISLLDSALKLKTAQVNEQLASQAYDMELVKLSKQFKGYIKDIDDKSAYLREVIRRINLAASEDERKEAMLLLSELGGFRMSERDFKDFIDGKKQIRL